MDTCDEESVVKDHDTQTRSGCASVHWEVLLIVLFEIFHNKTLEKKNP